MQNLSIKEIHSPCESQLANDLIEWYSGRPEYQEGRPIYEVAKRHHLAYLAQYAHPLVKGRDDIVAKGILEINQTLTGLKRTIPGIDLCEVYILLAKGELSIPPTFKSIEEVLWSSLRYIAYGRVEYWTPSIKDLSESNETIISLYKEYYEELYARSS
jgi:hypothetical protein